MCAGLDLKVSFLHVPMSARVKKFLRFKWKGKLYEWQVLPFGLKCSPRILTFMVAPIIKFLHGRGISLTARDYQDDDNKILEIEDDNNSHPPSNQGDTPPRDQLGTAGTSQGVQSVRRPPGPPGPQDSVPRAPEGIVTLKPTDLLACFENPKKCKANTEVFHAFTGHKKGNDPSHN